MLRPASRVAALCPPRLPVPPLLRLFPPLDRSRSPLLPVRYSLRGYSRTGCRSWTRAWKSSVPAPLFHCPGSCHRIRIRGVYSQPLYRSEILPWLCRYACASYIRIWYRSWTRVWQSSAPAPLFIVLVAVTIAPPVHPGGSPPPGLFS